jgi:hypothetical protein
MKLFDQDIDKIVEYVGGTRTKKSIKRKICRLIQINEELKDDSELKS